MNPARFIGGYPPMIYATFFSLPQRQVVFVVVSCCTCMHAFPSFLLKRLKTKINIFPFVASFTCFDFLISFYFKYYLEQSTADMRIIRYELLNVSLYVYDAAIIYKSIEKDFNISRMCVEFFLNINIFLINFYLI